MDYPAAVYSKYTRIKTRKTLVSQKISTSFYSVYF